LILQHVRAGMTNREIANELGAGRRSVDRWRASVLEKIGAATTVELITLIARVDEYRRQGGWLPRLVARITQQRLANLLPPILNSREEIPV
jgi:transposase